MSTHRPAASFSPFTQGIHLYRPSSSEPERDTRGGHTFHEIPAEIADLARIRHEETHWLQSIGTTCGLFGQLIRLAQSNTVLVLIQRRVLPLNMEVFPLKDIERTSPAFPYIYQWKQMEVIYRSVFGGISLDSFERMQTEAPPTLTAFMNLDGMTHVLTGVESEGTSAFDALVKESYKDLDERVALKAIKRQ